MSMRQPDFAGEVALIIKKFPFYGAATISAELTTITTALGTDTTTHSKLIEEPPAGLKILHHSNANSATTNTPFTNQINLAINKGKAGNLNQSQMLAGIDDAIGLAHAPAIVDVPYVSANASPPVVGTVCTTTVGNWVGIPTSYTYQWTRNNVNIAAATAATYTLVAADTGSKQIRAVVTATNATGSTAAPPSNAIFVP